MGGIAKREHPLLGTRFLLVAARTTKGCVEAVRSERLLSASVFMMSVISALPWVIGEMPIAHPLLVGEP